MPVPMVLPTPTAMPKVTPRMRRRWPVLCPVLRLACAVSVEMQASRPFSKRLFANMSLKCERRNGDTRGWWSEGQLGRFRSRKGAFTELKNHGPSPEVGHRINAGRKTLCKLPSYPL